MYMYVLQFTTMHLAKISSKFNGSYQSLFLTCVGNSGYEAYVKHYDGAYRNITRSGYEDRYTFDLLVNNKQYM